MTVRKPKYKLSDFRKTTYNKPLNKLTSSQREKYDNYKEYIRDYKGFQRERKQASTRVLYESTRAKIKNKTPRQALNIWADYSQKKEKIQVVYEDKIERFYTTFKIREKKLKTVRQFTFKSRNVDRYAKSKRMQNVLRNNEGYVQIVIKFTDQSGYVRYYSKTYFNDPTEFTTDTVEQWIEDTLEFFEDDSFSYNASGWDSIEVISNFPLNA